MTVHDRAPAAPGRIYSAPVGFELCPDTLFAIYNYIGARRDMRRAEDILAGRPSIPSYPGAYTSEADRELGGLMCTLETRGHEALYRIREQDRVREQGIARRARHNWDDIPTSASEDEFVPVHPRKVRPPAPPYPKPVAVGRSDGCAYPDP